MATTLLIAFLVAHGFLHAAIWLPRPESREPSAPFAPDHSALLVAVSVPRTTAQLLTAALALGTGAAYLLTGLGAAADAAWTPAAATVAALLGLLLELTFFNRWLIVGIALDAAVLSSALLEWPVSLT